MNQHFDLAKICSYPSQCAIQLLVILQNNLLFLTLKQMTLLFVEGVTLYTCRKVREEDDMQQETVSNL